MQEKSSIPGGSEKIAKAGAIFEAKFRRSTQTCCYLRSKKRMNGIDPQAQKGIDPACAIEA